MDSKFEKAITIASILYPNQSKVITFNHLQEDEWKDIQKCAAKCIQTYKFPVNERIIKHWYNIVNGIVPYDLKVLDGDGNEIEPKAHPFTNDIDEVGKRLSWSDDQKELIRIMLDICLHDNNKDSFTEEQKIQLKLWKTNL